MNVIARAPSTIQVYPISENAVTLEFGDAVSERLMHTITAFDSMLCQNPFPGLLATVPAYTTLTVYFDPRQVSGANIPGNTPLQKVSYYLKKLPQSGEEGFITDVATVNIPVCYDREFAPDIDEVAAINHMTVNELISIHTSALYLVHMIGFMPGFAYLGGMAETIAAPRKAKPRASVPAGAVGIAGTQTGIYPLQTPGGWQIIGRTPIKMFDASREKPSLLKAGDRVRFEAISLTGFKAYREG